MISYKVPIYETYIEARHNSLFIQYYYLVHSHTGIIRIIFRFLWRFHVKFILWYVAYHFDSPIWVIDAIYRGKSFCSTTENIFIIKQDLWKRMKKELR